MEMKMPKYKVRWNYESRNWNGDIITLRKGEVVELEEAVADWVSKDSPGVLHEVGDKGASLAPLRLLEEAPKDRMVRKARGKR